MMSNKTTVEDSVSERRLRPIYDWLDNGNNRKAIQEADKVLRKQPKLKSASVLKALALLRQGRNAECSEIIKPVVSEGTADDATLQALTICYREMHQPELICSIYEKAAKLDPNNEDIMSHLFMAHVRVGNYKKQHQTALLLYKIKPKNPYYFWAVMSIVMQSHVAKDNTARKVGLELAERMILKFVKEDKIDSEAEVLTYLYILEIQGKYKEALEVLDGPLVKKIVQQPQNFIPMKRATYNMRLQQHEAASIIYKDSIHHEVDNWQHYVNFTECILAEWQNHTDSSQGQIDPLISASEFLQEIRNNTSDDVDTYRSPHLGILQFTLKLKENGLEDKISSLCGDITEQLFTYVEYFGDKMCCFGDIVNFLPLVQKEDAPPLLEKIKALVQMDEDQVPIDVKNIHRHQIWMQLCRALGQHSACEIDQQLEFADYLVDLYERTASISTQMVSTDIRPNDAYLIMAAHCYFAALPPFVRAAVEASEGEKMAATRNATALLVKLCCLLEHGTNLSKANFQLKLLLIKAYNMIGATQASYSIYEKLDLKQVQMDTLGHVLAFQILDTGGYTLAANIFSSTLKFFMANYKDTSDPLIMSYKFGSLILIPEFVAFRERLNNSLHFATVTAEKMLLELTTGVNSKGELESTMGQMDIDPANDKTDWDDLQDNRDLSVMNTWEPQERKLQPEMREETFSDEIVVLRLRNTILRIVSASFKLRRMISKSNLNNNNKKSVLANGDAHVTCDTSAIILKDLIQMLHTQIANCDKYTIAKTPKIPLQGSDVPRIYVYAKGYYAQCVVQHAEALLRIYHCTEGSEGLDSWSGATLKGLLETTERMIAFHTTQLDLLNVTSFTALPLINTTPLTHLSHFIQTVALVTIFVECCSSLVAPLKAQVAKKNKKKGNLMLPEIVIHHNNHVTSVVSKLDKFEAALNDKVSSLRNECTHTPSLQESDYSDLNLIIPTLDPKMVCENIRQSFLFSLTNLHLALRDKLKFLQTLKV